MTLPVQITKREFEKFRQGGDGYPAVAVVNPDGSTISGGGGSNATVAIGSAVTLYAVTSSSAVNSGNVTLNPGPNFIGLATVVVGSPLPAGTNLIGGVSIYGSLSASFNSNVTLNPGPNQIGSVTISNVISLASINGQVLNVAGTNYIGLASVNIGGTLPALTAGTAFVGLASIQGNINLNAGTNFIGLVSTASINGNVLNVAGSNYIGLASVNIGGTLPALTASSAFIGLVSTASINGNVNLINSIGLVSNASLSTNFLDSMMLGQYGGKTSLASGSFHPIQIDNSGNQIMGTGTNFIGLVSTASINGNVLNVAGANYIGLASVNIGGTLPALTAGAAYIGLASVNIGGTLPALVAGSAYIGLASVNIGGTLPALTTGSAFVGLASVQGNVNLQAGISQIGSVTISNVISLASINGNVLNVAGTNYIGLASVNIGGTLPALTAGTSFIGLVSAASINGNVNLINSIGLVSNASVATNFIDSMVLGQFGGGAKGSLASGSFHPLQSDSSGNIILGTGTNFIGGVSIYGTLTANVGMTTLFPGPNQIGSVTVANSITIGNSMVTVTLGTKLDSVNDSIFVNWTQVTGGDSHPNTDLFRTANASAITGPLQIANMNYNGSTWDRTMGDTTNGLYVQVKSAVPAGGNFIGLVSTASIKGRVDIVGVTTGGNKTLNITPIAINTSNMSGATVFVNASAKTWYITNLILSTASNVGLAFISNGTYLTGNASLRMQLAAQSGIVENGSPYAPLYTGLTTQTAFQIINDTGAPLTGRVTWYEE